GEVGSPTDILSGASTDALEGAPGTLAQQAGLGDIAPEVAPTTLPDTVAPEVAPTEIAGPTAVPTPAEPPPAGTTFGDLFGERVATPLGEAGGGFADFTTGDLMANVRGTYSLADILSNASAGTQITGADQIAGLSAEGAANAPASEAAAG